MLGNALLRNKTISALLRVEFKINLKPSLHYLDKKELVISFKKDNTNSFPVVQMLDF